MRFGMFAAPFQWFPGVAATWVGNVSALAGVRIVEWSRHFPAAMAAMHLADQGAEVVTIGRADDQDRLVPGYLAWTGAGTITLVANAPGCAAVSIEIDERA